MPSRRMQETEPFIASGAENWVEGTVGDREGRKPFNYICLLIFERSESIAYPKIVNFRILKKSRYNVAHILT